MNNSHTREFNRSYYKITSCYSYAVYKWPKLLKPWCVVTFSLLLLSLLDFLSAHPDTTLFLHNSTLWQFNHFNRQKGGSSKGTKGNLKLYKCLCTIICYIQHHLTGSRFYCHLWSVPISNLATQLPAYAVISAQILFQLTTWTSDFRIITIATLSLLWV